MGGVGVYDHIHSCYYLYGLDSISNRMTLYCLNTSTGIASPLGYPVFSDTAGLNSLVCNSTTGKLYFFTSNNYTSKNAIYEITPNATGFSQRLVFDTASSGWGINIFSPVIDENTDYIYFFISTSGLALSTGSLIKVDPTSGSSSFVASPGISPSGLIYNNNDGLFYGMNVVYNPNGVYPNYISRVSFISIDPGNGSIHTIVDSMGNLILGGTFDYCNNLYVAGDGCLEPSTGQLVKLFSSSAIWSDPGIY